MAEFVMGESPLEEIRACPYENNHRIKLKSMEAHLEKCRSRNLPKRYQKCPYNPNHVKFVEEMPLHIEICPDLMHFGRQFAIDDAVAPTDKTLATQTLMHKNVTGKEDWDDKPEPVTYNPTQKLYETRFQPKNMHQRSERIYHPDAQLVITPMNNDEPYLSGEGGGGVKQETPYNDDEPIYNSEAAQEVPDYKAATSAEDTRKQRCVPNFGNDTVSGPAASSGAIKKQRTSKKKLPVQSTAVQESQALEGQAPEGANLELKLVDREYLTFDDNLLPCDYSSLLVPPQSDQEEEQDVAPEEQFQSTAPQLPEEPLPVGGLVSVGIANLTSSYARLHWPCNFTLLGMCDLIHAALQAGRIVAVNNQRWIEVEPFANPDTPMVPFGQAIFVTKAYKARFKGQPVILYLCIDPLGVPWQGPLCPTGALFEHLDEQTQAEIIEDLSQYGSIILPAELLHIRFNLIEEVDLLPPRPVTLTSAPMEMLWSDMNITMALWKGKWEDNPPSGFPFTTPDHRVRVVCQLTQTGEDLAMASPAASILEVREERTRRVILRTPVLHLNQISLTFWSDDEQNFLVLPNSLLPSGSFEVLIVFMQGAPEDQRLPPEFTLEPGALAASLQRTIDMPRPIPPETFESYSAMHEFFWDNFFAPDDLFGEEED